MEDSVIGSEVDGYRIQEILGQGGMGVVYKAEDVALSRDVAIKRINPSLANDEAFLRRFRSEARALARIDSPYIVGVHALRQTDIGLLLVMEYVAGGTVKDLTRKGPMDWQDALPIVKQMLAALEHAHGAEVIHRDIKPQNVMLSEEGTVKVTDFGLAKVHRPDSNKTVTQGVFGTLNYMSPEQVQGSAELDHRSDLYSMGMTIYEMLAGDLPFEEDSNEFTKMQRIVKEELPPPTELYPEVPEGISALVMRSLEKDPDDRFQSAEEMREAFEGFEEEHSEGPTKAPSRPAHQPTSPESGRWPVITALAALVLLVAGSGYLLLSGQGLFGSSAQSSGEGNGGSGLSETRVTVNTEPSGGILFLDENQIGEAPLDTSLGGEEVRVRATMAGRDTTDTLLALAQIQEADLNLPLDALDSGGPTAEASTSAEHSDNGSSTEDSPSGDSSDPATDDRAEDEPTYGALVLNASPSSSVSATVDGEAQEVGQSIRVRTGTREIRITHPERGSCDTTLTVQEGEEPALTCHFQHEVIVQTPLSATFAQVFINGDNTNRQTQFDTTLATGRTYRIEGRRQADEITVTGGSYLKRGDESGPIGDREEFDGSTKTVTLRPAFERMIHGITFEISDSGP